MSLETEKKVTVKEDFLIVSPEKTESGEEERGEGDDENHEKEEEQQPQQQQPTTRAGPIGSNPR